jgi:hypothetical protein
MTQDAQIKLERIADEVERLEESGGWNLKQFRRLYSAAIEACEGDERQLEFFGPFMLNSEYFDDALRLSREFRSAA